MSKIAKIFGGGQKQQTLQPLPPLPTRADPAIEDARKRQLQSSKLRKGRRQSILTSGSGLEDELGTVTRPQASSKLLG